MILSFPIRFKSVFTSGRRSQPTSPQSPTTEEGQKFFISRGNFKSQSPGTGTESVVPLCLTSALPITHVADSPPAISGTVPCPSTVASSTVVHFSESDEATEAEHATRRQPRRPRARSVDVPPPGSRGVSNPYFTPRGTRSRTPSSISGSPPNSTGLAAVRVPTIPGYCF